MDQGLPYLFAAFFVAWLALLLYLLVLSARLTAARRELKALKKEVEGGAGDEE